MTIILPADPKPASMTPELMSARNNLTPAFGGPVSRLTRLGSRWAFEVMMPELSYQESLGFRGLLDESETVRIAIDQPGIDLSGLGAAVVADGAGQLGSVLNIRGANNGVTIPAGVFLTVTTLGQPFVYEVREPVTTALAKAAMKVRPLLRVSPADGDAVSFGAPFIEGFASVGRDAFKAGPGGYLKNLSFRIEEVE